MLKLTPVTNFNQSHVCKQGVTTYTTGRVTQILIFNSFPTSGDFCRLLLTFANSLDPDQAQRFVGPDLDSNCLTSGGIPERFF